MTSRWEALGSETRMLFRRPGSEGGGLGPVGKVIELERESGDVEIGRNKRAAPLLFSLDRWQPLTCRFGKETLFLEYFYKFTTSFIIKIFIFKKNNKKL